MRTLFVNNNKCMLVDTFGYHYKLNLMLACYPGIYEYYNLVKFSYVKNTLLLSLSNWLFEYTCSCIYCL